MGNRGVAGLVPAILLVLMVAYAAPFAWSSLIPDGIRDLASALAIARGEAFPGAGPLINFAFPLGPLSLYVLAVPLVFTPSFTDAAMWIGVLGSLKFPLAYATGATLSGPALGLLLALAAALPSLAGYQPIYPFHPVLVEPLAWATLWLAARCAIRPSLASLYGAALAAGVAIQFHPTAAFYAPLAWLVLLARRDAFPAWPLHAFALALPVLAPFLRWPIGTLGVGASLSAPMPLAQALADVPALLRGAFWDVPAYFVADTLWPQRAAAGDTTLARAVIATVYAVALRGAFVASRLAPRVRRAGMLALVALPAGVAIVSSMRQTVGFYTLFYLLPVWSALLGIAFHAATVRRGEETNAAYARAPRGFTLVAVALAALAVAMSARTVDAARDGVLDLHLGALADPRHVTAERIRVARYSSRARDEVGPRLCDALAAPRGVVLHGELAFGVAASFGIDLRMHCPSRIDEGKLPRILGRDEGAEHWLALARASWMRIGREPSRWEGELGFAQPGAVLHPPTARTLDTRWRYYEVVRDRQPPQTLRYEVPAGPARHLLVTRLQPWDTLHEVAVTCAGARQSAVERTFTMEVFPLAAGSCEVVLATDVPDAVGIAAF